VKTIPTILVVDDQPEILENLELTLEAAGYHVQTARDGLEALRLLQEQQVDLILADIAMPRMNGYQLYESVRQDPQWAAVPFVFLTARALDSDIRFGKELGVDDYLTKPLQPEDLLAVVQGKLRRAEQLSQQIARSRTDASAEAGLLTVGRLRIDPKQHRVWMDDLVVSLSAKEFTLLETLARQAGNVLSPQELIQATHHLDTDYVDAGSLLRPLIRTLRRKLGYPTGEMGCIENVRGVGYRLVKPS
jgi:DNA-binding response OmpR family regulator